MTHHITRRSILAAAPALACGPAVAAMTPDAAQVGCAKLRTAPDTSSILDVIHELESWECWENSSIVAAKAYAAYRMREALGLDLPHPKYARAHLDLQVWNFEDYRKSIWYERDKAAGKTMTAPRPGLSIG